MQDGQAAENGVLLATPLEQSGGDLTSRVRAAFPGLSQKQARLARYLLEEEWEVAFSSAAQIGARVGVNAATVVRFAQALGYQGFTGLQEEIRARLPRFVRSAERIRAEATRPNSPAAVRGRELALQICNLERTAELIAPEAFDQAVERIVTARRVVLSGAGLAASVAGHLGHTLKKIGVDTREASQGGIQLALELAGCRERDLFIAIGFLRYVRDTVEGLNQAVRLGIPALAITDNCLSPLARRANQTLIVAAEGLQGTSIVAAIALADALVAAAALRQPQRSMRALERSDALYHGAGLLLD
jgi:DNA-binding MurR/RpiR family transcriptional regulator